MMEPILDTVALFALLFFIRSGVKYGAFAALRWMLASVLALLVSFRYWAVACQLASGGKPPYAVVVAGAFWLIFIVIVFGFMKACEDYIEAFDGGAPTIGERLIGGIFAAVTGAVFVSSALLTVSLVFPGIFPAKTEILPLPIEKAPVAAYRFVEARLAGIAGKDFAHTRLPEIQGEEKSPVFQ